MDKVEIPRGGIGWFLDGWLKGGVLLCLRLRVGNGEDPPNEWAGVHAAALEMRE